MFVCSFSCPLIDKQSLIFFSVDGFVEIILEISCQLDRIDLVFIFF